MHAFVYLFICFIYLFIYSLSHCQVGQVGLSREKGLDIGRRPLHHISFLCSSRKFIFARFPILQTITGTRLHILSRADVLCMHVGTLQVIIFVTIFLCTHCLVASFEMQLYEGNTVIWFES